MPLNGWQRLGIVTSVLWAIGATLFQLKDFSEQKYASYKYYVIDCYEIKDAKASRECYSKASEKSEIPIETQATVISILAFVPVLFAWLFAYIIIGTVRWIRKGFKLA